MVPAGKYLLGDKAYQSVPQVIAPLKENQVGFTRRQKLYFNHLHGHFRARVEQGIRVLKVWGICRARWRSNNPTLLAEALRVVANFANLTRVYDVPYLPI